MAQWGAVKGVFVEVRGQLVSITSLVVGESLRTKLKFSDLVASTCILAEPPCQHYHILKISAASQLGSHC